MAKKRETRGRKSGVKKWLTKERLTLIEGWARSGLSNKQISENIGVTEQTLYRWINQEEKIAKALKKGKEVVDYEVENAMLKSALGYEVEEVKTYQKKDKDGNIVQHMEKTKRYIQPSVNAQTFWLKNRMPEKWNENLQIEHSGNLTHNIDNKLSQLTEDQLLKLTQLRSDEDDSE